MNTKSNYCGMVTNDCVPCKEQSISGVNLWRWRRNEEYVRSEVLSAVTMKNAVCWDVTPCDS
jgi:hypothetical protein